MLSYFTDVFINQWQHVLYYNVAFQIYKSWPVTTSKFFPKVTSVLQRFSITDFILWNLSTTRWNWSSLHFPLPPTVPENFSRWKFYYFLFYGRQLFWPCKLPVRMLFPVNIVGQTLLSSNCLKTLADSSRTIFLKLTNPVHTQEVDCLGGKWIWYFQHFLLQT